MLSGASQYSGTVFKSTTLSYEVYLQVGGDSTDHGYVIYATWITYISQLSLLMTETSEMWIGVYTFIKLQVDVIFSISICEFSRHPSLYPANF